MLCGGDLEGWIRQLGSRLDGFGCWRLLGIWERGQLWQGGVGALELLGLESWVFWDGGWRVWG